MNKHLPYDRSQRVADEIHEIVSGVLLAELTDPRLSGATVTRVRVTKDLRIARIYFQGGGGDPQAVERMAAGFKSAAGFLRRRIAEALTLKFAPEIECFYDETLDVSERVDELLAGIREGERHE